MFWRITFIGHACEFWNETGLAWAILNSTDTFGGTDMFWGIRHFWGVLHIIEDVWPFTLLLLGNLSLLVNFQCHLIDFDRFPDACNLSMINIKYYFQFWTRNTRAWSRDPGRKQEGRREYILQTEIIPTSLVMLLRCNKYVLLLYW